MTEIPAPLYVLICKSLFDLAVPPHIRGYGYLINGIAKVSSDQTYLRAITKRLYPDIAADFETTPQRVERSIRTAVEIAFTRSDIESLERYFGNAINPKSGKITNSAFMAGVAAKIKLIMLDGGARSEDRIHISEDRKAFTGIVEK